MWTVFASSFPPPVLLVGFVSDKFLSKKTPSFFWVGFGEKTQVLFDQFESQKMALAEKGAVRQRGDGVKSR